MSGTRKFAFKAAQGVTVQRGRAAVSIVSEVSEITTWPRKAPYAHPTRAHAFLLRQFLYHLLHFPRPKDIGVVKSLTSLASLTTLTGQARIACVCSAKRFTDAPSSPQHPGPRHHTAPPLATPTGRLMALPQAPPPGCRALALAPPPPWPPLRLPLNAAPALQWWYYYSRSFCLMGMPLHK